MRSRGRSWSSGTTDASVVAPRSPPSPGRIATTWNFDGPPYAPEMNPDEGLSDVLKDDRWARYGSTSCVELERTVRAEMRRWKRDPRKVPIAIRQTELPIHELVPAEAPA